MHVNGLGVVPPDLSLVARKRGEKWLYTYLNSFYEDNANHLVANNLLIPNVAMPDVLAPLVGQSYCSKVLMQRSMQPLEYC